MEYVKEITVYGDHKEVSHSINQLDETLNELKL